MTNLLSSSAAGTESLPTDFVGDWCAVVFLPTDHCNEMMYWGAFNQTDLYQTGKLVDRRLSAPALRPTPDGTH